MRKIDRKIVAAVLISKDKKVLMGKHPAGACYASYWVIPGGGVEEGESDIEALNREILEETAIDISSYEPRLIDDDQTAEREKILRTGEKVIACMKFHDYKVQLDQISKDISFNFEPAEFVDMRWFDVNELRSLELSKPSETLFKKMNLL